MTLKLDNHCRWVKQIVIVVVGGLNITGIANVLLCFRLSETVIAVINFMLKRILSSFKFPFMFLLSRSRNRFIMPSVEFLGIMTTKWVVRSLDLLCVHTTTPQSVLYEHVKTLLLSCFEFHDRFSSLISFCFKLKWVARLTKT